MNTLAHQSIRFFSDNIMDLIRNMVPSNLIAATFQKYKTVTREYSYNVTLSNGSVVTETGERVFTYDQASLARILRGWGTEHWAKLCMLISITVEPRSNGPAKTHFL